MLASSRDAQRETPRFSRITASVKSHDSVARLQGSFPHDVERLTVYQNQNVKAASESDVILLAVEPIEVEPVLTAPGLGQHLEGKLIISVAAGWTRQRLEALTGAGSGGNGSWVIRTLPNTAAVVHEGLTVIEAPDADTPTKFMKLTKSIFDCVGKTIVLPPRLLDAATAVGGSTPAFFSVICEAFIDASVAVGVPRDAAHEMISQSMLGTARMLQAGTHPALIKDKGTSPEGCTMSGLMVLEQGAVRGNVGRALREAVTVARRMGRGEHVNDTRRE